jgi:ABC-type lipoprotein export system ATPase subunit
MQIIRESNEKLGTTVIMVTHDAGFADLAKRKINLADGRIVN